MRCSTTFLLFIVLTQNIYSQTTSKDSVLNLEIKKRLSPFLKDSTFTKATNFYFEKNWDSTLVYTNKLLVTSKTTPYVKDYIHFFRGESFKNKKSYDEAKIQFTSISKTFDFYYLVQTYLAEIAIENNEYEKVISILRELTQLSDEEYQLIDKDIILNNIGIAYLYQKKYANASFYFQESIKNEKDSVELIGRYNNIANLYYNQYMDDIAINYFTYAYDLSKKVKLSPNTTDPILFSRNKKIFRERFITAFNMAIVEENRKNFQKSLNYRKESASWKDSLNNQNNIYAVAQKEKEFAVAIKQQEVDLLQVENELKETQRTIFLYSSIGLFLFLSVGAYFFVEKVKTTKIIAAQKETLDELNMTKDKLFSIVSHDLRSSVNALKTSNKVLIDNLKSKDISALENLLHKNSNIVNGAYGLLDNLLNWALLQTEQQYFHVEKLFLYVLAEHVSYNYRALMSDKQLVFENSISKKDVAYADRESLKIILRNLIDNAIKFSKQKGSLRIYTRTTDRSYCDLVVEDTGLGMSETARLKLLEDSVLLNKKEHEDIIGTGLGIQLCKSMIKKNNGKFDIESELGKGTKMIVSLPKALPNG